MFPTRRPVYGDPDSPVNDETCFFCGPWWVWPVGMDVRLSREAIQLGCSLWVYRVVCQIELLKGD